MPFLLSLAAWGECAAQGGHELLCCDLALFYLGRFAPTVFDRRPRCALHLLVALSWCMPDAFSLFRIVDIEIKQKNKQTKKTSMRITSQDQIRNDQLRSAVAKAEARAQQAKFEFERGSFFPLHNVYVEGSSILLLKDG